MMFLYDANVCRVTFFLISTHHFIFHVSYLIDVYVAYNVLHAMYIACYACYDKLRK